MIWINPPKFIHEFESGFRYEATILVDDGYESVQFVAYDEAGVLIVLEASKWFKQSSLFAERRFLRHLRKVERDIHTKMQNHYKRNIFYVSAFEKGALTKRFLK